MSNVPSTRGTILEKWKPGEPLDHKKLNQVIDLVAAMVRGCKAPQQIYPDQSTTAAVQVQQFKIVSIAGDYVVCNPYNGLQANTDSSILVAKPPELRTSRASWNGITYAYSGNQTRVATSGSDTENQVVVPSYVVGDVIFGIKNIIGGTGVKLNDDPIDWLDQNVAGRAWAKEDET